MTNYDLTPVGSDKDGVRLYGDSMEPIVRGQKHAVTRHAPQLGGTPSSDFEGLEPGEIGIRGTWAGSDASDLADRLRSIVNDESITDVELQAVDDDGTDVDSPHDGTYRIADNAEVTQPVAGRDEVWEYTLTLTEL